MSTALAEPPPATSKPEVVIPPIRKPQGAPQTPPKAPPAVSTPPPAEKPVQDASGGNDDIDTDILPKKKTNSDFAAERRENKTKQIAKELGVDELRRERDDYLAKHTTTAQELLAERAEKVRLAQRAEELEALTKQRDEELTRQREQYFDTYKPQVSMEEDQELQQAHQSMRGALINSLPTHIQNGESKLRVFAADLLDDPVKQKSIDTALMAYADGANQRNPSLMDRAVQFMAKTMGADVELNDNPELDKLLDRDDPTLNKIEQAMRQAMPGFAARRQRESYLKDQASVIVQQQLAARTSTISQNLKDGLFLDDQRLQVLSATDPLNPVVLMHDILSSSPEVKREVEMFIAGASPSLAVMGEIRMPTLASKDPAAVQQHRQQLVQHRGKLAEIMQLAAFGRAAHSILPSLMGELDALRQRAGDIAVNQNPGGTRVGDDAGQHAVESDDIPTDILPPKRR